MPPEQAQGKSDQVDARSDIFAVGAVMFRVLTGRAVHDAKAATERLFQAMKERAPSLGIVAPHLPTWVVGVVDKALAFDKKDRWETAEEMRKAVRETFAQLKEEAQRVRPLPGAPAPEHDGSIEVSQIFGAMLEPSIVVDVSFADLVPSSSLRRFRRSSGLLSASSGASVRPIASMSATRTTSPRACATRRVTIAASSWSSPSNGCSTSRAKAAASIPIGLPRTRSPRGRGGRRRSRRGPPSARAGSASSIGFAAPSSKRA